MAGEVVPHQPPTTYHRPLPKRLILVDDNKKKLAAIGLVVVAVALILWQTVLRRNPEAVGVEDMPASARLQPGTQRDAAAGPIPVDISRSRGKVSAAPKTNP